MYYLLDLVYLFERASKRLFNVDRLSCARRGFDDRQAQFSP